MKKSKYFFITGTDTGVGKTHFTLALALFLQKNKLNFNLIKPIETGCNPDPEDGLLYKKYIFPEQKLNKIVPFQYKIPASPYISAKFENSEINYNNLLKSTIVVMAPIIIFFIYTIFQLLSLQTGTVS